MRIYHNVPSLKSANRMATNNAEKSKNLERLSSGLRINRAADDAAGLAISEKMRGQQRGLSMAMRNAEDGKSMVSTAESAQSQVGEILGRMRELAIQAANGTNSNDERDKIKGELSGLFSEVDRIADSTKFNGKTLINGGGASLSSANIEGAASVDSIEIEGAKDGVASIKISTSAADGKVTAELINAGAETIASQMVDLGSDTYEGTINFDKLGVSIDTNGGSLNGDFGAGVTDTVAATGGSLAAKIQIGANSGETITLNIGNVNTTALGLAVGDLNIATGDDTADGTTIDSLITKLDTALSSVSSARSDLGTISNRLDFAIANLQSSHENLTAAESRVRDVDMAKEMMEFTKNNILAQAGNMMLSQSFSMPQSVLQLLQG